MISSGKLSDRRVQSLVNEDGSCDTNCPHLNNTNYTCKRTTMTIFQNKHKQLRAHCNEATHVALRNNRSLNI